MVVLYIFCIAILLNISLTFGLTIRLESEPFSIFVNLWGGDLFCNEILVSDMY